MTTTATTATATTATTTTPVEQQSDNVYVFMLNSARTEIQNELLLQKFGQSENTQTIKKNLSELINLEYESQRSAVNSIIERVVNSYSNSHSHSYSQGSSLEYLISEALKPPFSIGSSAISKFIHCNTLFKACVEYESTKLNEHKINTMMSTIDAVLSTPDFIEQFKNENPDINDAIIKFKDNKYNKDNKSNKTNKKIVKVYKPRYFIWGVSAISLFTGTSIMFYFYLKKKN